MNMNNRDEDCGPDYQCDECDVIEETFDYSGTHCNNGKSGTHRTGIYLSSCCDSHHFTEI